MRKVASERIGLTDPEGDPYLFCKQDSPLRTSFRFWGTAFASGFTFVRAGLSSGFVAFLTWALMIFNSLYAGQLRLVCDYIQDVSQKKRHSTTKKAHL